VQPRDSAAGDLGQAPELGIGSAQDQIMLHNQRRNPEAIRRDRRPTLPKLGKQMSVVMGRLTRNKPGLRGRSPAAPALQRPAIFRLIAPAPTP